MRAAKYPLPRNVGAGFDGEFEVRTHVSWAAVADVQVIGIPDEKYGEELCAWIRLAEGQTATVDDIKAYCTDNLAHFKVPRHVLFVDEFPMTVTGKIQKFKMRETTIEQLGLHAAAATKHA